jgi:hypothetical protein
MTEHSTITRRDLLLCAGGFSVLSATAGIGSILNRGLSDPKAIASAVDRL